MSHVDEGALHAYLDGALDEYPDAEAQRIRAHLESCQRCAGDLEVASKLRSEAMAILGLAAPDLALPTLEELRAVEKQRRPAPPTPRPAPRRLIWAASIAVAVGAGWLIREGQLRQADPALTGPVAVPAATLAQSDGPGPEAATDGSEAGSEPRPGGQVDEIDERRRMASMDDASGPGDAVALLAETVDAPSALVAERVAEPRLLSTASVARVGFARVPSPSEAQRPVEPTASPGDRAGGLVPVASASAVDRSGLPRRRVLSDDDLPRDKAVALAVPGYEVVSIVNLGAGTTSLGVHVRQSLDSSATFDVFHLEAGVAPEVLDPTPADMSEVRVETGEGWVVIRGPLDDATLSELLARLFPE